MVPPCSASKTIPHVKRPKSATLTTSDREKNTPGSGKAVEEFCPWHPTTLNFNFVNWCQKDADKCAPDGKIRECVNEVCVACGICSGYVCPPKRQLGSQLCGPATLGNWKEGFCQFLIIWLYLLTELSSCERGPTNLNLAWKTLADDVLASPIHTIFTTYANDGASLKVCYMIGGTPNMNMCRHCICICICVYINICICACRQVCHAMGAPDASWARALTPEQDAPCCLSSPNTNYETNTKTNTNAETNTNTKTTSSWARALTP